MLLFDRLPDEAEYTEACINFYHTSRKWLNIDNHFYTTNGYGEWEETSDNSNGGISIKWAFYAHSENEVKEWAHEEYVDKIEALLSLAEEEGLPYAENNAEQAQWEEHISELKALIGIPA